jgi:hypothetical protein
METNEQYLKRLLQLLKKPIPHSWRVQSYSKNKPVATVMAYIDQRDLMDVLDAYCDYGWQKTYQEIAGNLFCSIGINMPDGTTQWRSDCGVESNQDAEKGRASDAAKRAGVNWGVGRFLYDMKIQYVTTNAKKDAGNYPHCIDEQGKQIWDLTEHINNKNPDAPKAPTRIKEDTEAQRVANMQGVKVSEITIEEHKTAINTIPSAVGLGGYFNSLTNVEKANQDIIALLSARREELKVDTVKA